MTSDDSISDQQLLREFALSQSQSAFRTLVERHQSMVFGTARRRMLSDAAAADVAQNVFLALARKAAWLSARTNVGGWLYKSTLMESARRQRDEMRRGSRERLYSEEMNIRGTSDEDTDAPRAADLMPLLDDALSGLSDADREAIMLRFFRGLSLRETGAAMGTTEEAARKRVSRALEKLSSVFKRRGTAVSASLLAASLLPEAADAAVPAGLAAKVSTAADDSLVTLLSEDQRDAFSRFKSEEERNRQEVYAGSMLGDMQKSLLLSDTQKDRLFSLFSTQAAANGGDPGPWAWAHLMQPDQSASLSAILTEEQFNLWKQRYETFGRMFGGPPRSDSSAKPAEKP